MKAASFPTLLQPEPELNTACSDILSLPRNACNKLHLIGHTQKDCCPARQGSGSARLSPRALAIPGRKLQLTFNLKIKRLLNADASPDGTVMRGKQQGGKGGRLVGKKGI